MSTLMEPLVTMVSAPTQETAIPTQPKGFRRSPKNKKASKVVAVGPILSIRAVLVAVV